jgi:hypothetical protein
MGRFRLILPVSPLTTDTVQRPQVKQNVDQGIAISDGLQFTQLWTLDAQAFSQGIDPLNSRPLAVDLLVSVAVAVKLVTESGANAGGQGSGATAFGPLLVIDGARLAGLFRKA